jgi:AP-1 complex subunit mu
VLLQAHFNLPSITGGVFAIPSPPPHPPTEDADARPPISVKFEIPYFTTSGIQACGLCSVHAYNVQVRYLKIIEKSGYQALPWVRYITQNGGMPDTSRTPSHSADYQIRT